VTLQTSTAAITFLRFGPRGHDAMPPKTRKAGFIRELVPLPVSCQPAEAEHAKNSLLALIFFTSTAKRQYPLYLARSIPAIMNMADRRRPGTGTVDEKSSNIEKSFCVKQNIYRPVACRVETRMWY